MKSIRHAWFIAVKDLKIFFRDRVALFFFIVFPFMFIILFNFLLSGVGTGDDRLELHVLSREPPGGLSRPIIAAMATISSTLHQMRTVRFGLRDRLAVVPMELRSVLPWAAGVLVVAVALQLVFSGKVSLAVAARSSLPFWGAMAVGSVLVPVLLPLLPGRAFTVKALGPGVLWAAGWCILAATGPVAAAGYLLLLPAIAAFLAMSFTGATTFTSLSGVRVEVHVATPLTAAAAIAGLVLLTVAFFVGGPS